MQLIKSKPLRWGFEMNATEERGFSLPDDRSGCSSTTGPEMDLVNRPNPWLPAYGFQIQHQHTNYQPITHEDLRANGSLTFDYFIMHIFSRWRLLYGCSFVMYNTPGKAVYYSLSHEFSKFLNYMMSNSTKSAISGKNIFLEFSINVFIVLMTRWQRDYFISIWWLVHSKLFSHWLFYLMLTLRGFWNNYRLVQGSNTTWAFNPKCTSTSQRPFKFGKIQAWCEIQYFFLIVHN